MAQERPRMLADDLDGTLVHLASRRGTVVVRRSRCETLVRLSSSSEGNHSDGGVTATVC